MRTILDGYFGTRFWNRGCDPRSANQWIMSGGPWKLIAISVGYLLSIVFGRRLMANRAAFRLRWSMFTYNCLLVAINVYFFYTSFWWTDYGAEILNFRFPPPDDRSPRAMTIVGLYHYYLLTKFIDYFDSFFFVLRKKDKQITALHVYHHVSVPFVGWLSNWASPMMPLLGLFTMLNSLCHILMYTYYALSALGPWFVRFLWWKSYITRIQLVQFLIIGVYGLALNALHEGYPLVIRFLPISQATIYLILFGRFYRSSYCPHKSKEVAATAAEEGEDMDKAKKLT